MPQFLIDVNLPRYFSLWASQDYIFVRDLNERWKDREIWEHARQHDMVIVSKDSDFSDRVMLSDPPPRVVHIKLGNLKMREFHTVLTRNWPWVLQNISRFRLIRIYLDRVEGVGHDP